MNKQDKIYDFIVGEIEPFLLDESNTRISIKIDGISHHFSKRFVKDYIEGKKKIPEKTQNYYNFLVSQFDIFSLTDYEKRVVMDRLYKLMFERYIK